MGVIRVVAEIPHKSGLPQDTVFNNFVFIVPSTPPSDSDMTKVAGALQGFYASVPSNSTRALGTYLGDQLDRGTGKGVFRFFNITDDGVPGVGPPVKVSTFTLPAVTAAGSPLPAEVSLCLSVHADLTGIAEVAPGGTRPRARRRGRIYLGPWAGDANSYNAARSTSLPASALTNTIINAAHDLLTSLIAQGIYWAVASAADFIARQIVGGYVDDAWDTQRRRGEDPQFRTAVPASFAEGASSASATIKVGPRLAPA